VNIFTLMSGIREVGYNCGTPMWVVQCGLGASITPENILRRLVQMGLREHQWVLIRNSYGERGLGSIVDAISHIHCHSEVEVRSSYDTPGWFTKVGRWTVIWERNGNFNLGALRHGQDMVVSEDLDGLLEATSDMTSIDRGYVSPDRPDEQLVSRLLADKVRWYQKVEV